MKKVVGIALLLASISACSKDTDPNYYGTVKPKHPLDEIWINNREEPQFTDPAKANGLPDVRLIQNMFYRLVALDPKTEAPVPELAERWEISEDGTRYTFFMRKGLKWSDGQPLTTEDVEYSWKRLMDPSTASEYQELSASLIENGDAFAHRAIHVTGFTDKIAATEIKPFLVKHEIPIAKIEERKNSNDFFLFVAGETGEVTQQNRERLLKLISDNHPWGEGVQAQITKADVVSAKALDSERFEVQLVAPAPYFILIAEHPSLAIVPKHVIEKFKADGKEDQWTRAENVVVNGPFKLKEEQFKQYKIYEKNPNYWDSANVKLNRVKIVMIEGETATLNSYKVGEMDWTGTQMLPAEQIPNLKNFKDYHGDPFLNVYYYILNAKKKPLDDVRVRKALSYAIDRQKITDHILGAGEKPMTGVIPDGLGGYKSNGPELYNPEKAKKLLAEAGYPDGKNFPKIKFMYDTKEVHRLIIQAVQEMWKQTLNVEIEPSNVEWKIYLDRLTARDFDMSRQGWIGDFLDPYTYLDTFKSNSGLNRTNWGDPELDSLIVQSSAERDPAKRNEIIQKAEAIVVDARAYIPVYLYTKTYMLKPFVKGFHTDYLDSHAWKWMLIDKDWK